MNLLKFSKFTFGLVASTFILGNYTLHEKPVISIGASGDIVSNLAERS